MSETADRVESLFAAAVALPPPDRAVFLDRECPDDPAVRDRVEKLLHAHERAGHMLDQLPADPGQTGAYVPSPEVGTVIAGRYKLLEEIGEGGMGTVWVAEQLEPIRRRVALKLVKPGMDSRSVLGRFEAERQALALMDHPNIAKVLDAGTVGQASSLPEQQQAGSLPHAGRPYFVMELVKGTPITTFCDARKLSPRERLGLFVAVCQAIQHAHSKGIIHRDIKPSNVLVALHDERPVPKVIDFGVAKAVGQQLTEKTIYTGFGTLVGTPNYMAPEQATFNQLDIDTRADVYALGVLLYELLAGSPPVEPTRLKQAALDEVLRIVREEEPPRPSQRLSTSQSKASIAAVRQTDPAKLTKLVRGELDWIVMKALEKDRHRRYATADGFAADVQRYLAGEQVQAVPPSVAYRLRKFARKNRAALITAAVIALSLVAGITISTWQAVRATRAESAALEALNEKEQARAAEAEQRERAEKGERSAKQREADTKAVLQFLEDRVFAAARPEGQDGGLGRQVTLQQAIATALPLVTQSFKDQPLIEAQLRMTLGKSYFCLGQPNVAAEQYDKAHKLFTQEYGPDHADALRSLAGLAACCNDLARYGDALKLYAEVLERQKATLGADHPDTLLSMIGLAYTLEKRGRYAECLKLREKVLTLQTAKLGPDHPDTLLTMNSLGSSYYAQGRNTEAARMLEETLTHRRNKLGDDHPDTLVTMSSLANAYNAQGRHAQAIKLMKETLAVRRSKLGPEHPRTLSSMNNLAWFLATVADDKLRDPAAALPLAVAAVQASPMDADPLSTLGTVRFRAGDCKGAIADLEKAIGLRNADNPVNAFEAFFLAMARWRLGDKDKAREWFAKAVQWMDQGLPDNAELKRFRAEAAELLGVEKE